MNISRAVEIRKVETPALKKAFIRLPWTAKIYKNDPAWVPPLISEMKKILDPQQSYFFERGEADLFLAFVAGKPVGRISAHINRPHDERYNDAVVFFGFFECIHNQEVADALFNAAAEWGRARGRTKIIGPESFSIYDQVGFATAGVEHRPTIGIDHTAPYYPELAGTYGFTKLVDWHAFMFSPSEEELDRFKPLRERLAKGAKVEFESLTMDKFDQWDRELLEVFNTAWDDNWGHIPMTERQWASSREDRRRIAVPELAVCARDQGKMVGFMITIPDLNPGLQKLNGRITPLGLLHFWRANRKHGGVRTIVMGILPEYRKRRIDHILYLLSIENGRRLGYKWSECSLVVDTNTALLNTFKRYNADQYKTYTLFEKNL